MATNKLDRIERDIEKTKTKIAELQKQLRELEAAKTEQSGAGSGQNRTGKFADRPACAWPEHDPAGVRRLCARRRFAGTPGPAAGF